MTPNRSRRGLSLIEVLIAFLILAVGVSSVIALFPIGVLSVQNAVNETKASMQAITAHGEVLANRWPDDQYLLAPPVQGVFGAQAAYLTPDPPAGAAAPLGGDPRGIHLGTTPPYVGTDPGRSLGTHPFLNNVFATVIRADGMAPPVPNGFNVAAPERFHPEAGAGAGFPVFVDPVLANARDFQFDPSPANCPMYKRVPIVQNLAMPGETFATMAPFTGALNDLVIHSLSEVQYQLAGSTIGGAPQLTSPSRRDQYLAQWFYSHDDLHFEESAATTPYNPSRLLQSPAVPGWRYVRSADSSDINTPQTLDPPGAAVLGGTASAASQNYATGSRTAAFSFAFVIKDRRLEPQPAGQTVAPLVVPTYPTGPSGVQPPYLVPRYGSYSPEQIQIMVFNKRTTMRGYHLVRACIYSGSSRATLSWDPAAGGSLPVIRRGMWLMEATLAPVCATTRRAPAPAPRPCRPPRSWRRRRRLRRLPPLGSSIGMRSSSTGSRPPRIPSSIRPPISTTRPSLSRNRCRIIRSRMPTATTGACRTVSIRRTTRRRPTPFRATPTRT